MLKPRFDPRILWCGNHSLSLYAFIIPQIQNSHLYDVQFYAVSFFEVHLDKWTEGDRGQVNLSLLFQPPECGPSANWYRQCWVWAGALRLHSNSLSGQRLCLNLPTVTFSLGSLDTSLHCYPSVCIRIWMEWNLVGAAGGPCLGMFTSMPLPLL